MAELQTAIIAQYLSSILQTPVQVLSVQELGSSKSRELKNFGYGKPYLIRFIADDKAQQVILESMSENSFGHDHFSDRAQSLLWYFSAANKLPKHARSLDVGAFTKDQQIIPLGKAEEFFVVNEFVEGREYAADLQRIQETGIVEPLDEKRAQALATYLAEIHATKNRAPALYARRIRDLLGHGECIMGLIDNYPANDPVASQQLLQQIEIECLKWRWKLKQLSHRLSQVHGDFHPWNILFQDGIHFSVLDRSRGEWGEPADDVTSLAMNYLFHSFQKFGVLQSGFEKLYQIFWDIYLKESNDMEILKIVPPFFAWRALVLANPIWYPSLAVPIREQLFRFIKNVLAITDFNPDKINELF